MITEKNASYYIGSNYLKAVDLVGVSDDTKPTNVGNGSTLHEIDTGKKYMFDAAGKEWYEQTSGGGSGGGSNTLVVTYTLGDAPGEATCDYTLAEIKDHLDNGGSVVAKIPHHRNRCTLLPLVEVYDSHDDLTFMVVDFISSHDGAAYVYYSYVNHYEDDGEEVIEVYYNSHIACEPAT